MTAASGGNSTYDSGLYRYHVFTSNGTLTVTEPGPIDVLAVGPGAGGGSAFGDAFSGAGGGAGEVVLVTDYELLSPATLNVSIGVGGAGGSGAGTNRGAAGFGTTSLAGSSTIAQAWPGGGGGAGNSSGGNSGNAGASGGGGAANSAGGASTAIYGDGNAGAAGTAYLVDPHYWGGGGGGAGAAGQAAGVGGAGLTIWGFEVGGGGGGGSYSSSATTNLGGLGGGGTGGRNSAGGNATPNTGGGGGGAGHAGASGGNPGGNGASGLLVVRYLIPEDPPPESAGLDVAPRRSISKLGCGDTEVWVCDRALRRPLVRLGFMRCEWGRELTEVSAAQVEIPEAWCSPLTSDALDGRIETWKHGLMIFRDGEPQWRGPIVDVSRPAESEVVTLDARDKMKWLDRRFLEVLLAFEGIDDAALFDILVAEAVRRDNRFRLFSSSRPTGTATDRSYQANSAASILSIIGDLDRVDWTMIDDALVSGADLWRDFERITVTESAFDGKIGCRLDGLSRATGWRISSVLNSGGTVSGEYESWTPAEGLIQQATSEPGLLDATAATERARERVTRNGGQPVAITLPALSAGFPATMSAISPGQHVDLVVNDPVFNPSGRYQVNRLTVTVANSEDGQVERAVIDVEAVG